jgi:hypothetical protein
MVIHNLRGRQAARDGTNYPPLGTHVTLGQIAGLRDDVDILVRISEWIDEFLVRSHPQLGRTGPVCPFALTARIRDLIRVSVIRLGDREGRIGEIAAVVRSHREAFLRVRETLKEDRIYSAMMMAFPDVGPEEAPELIDGTKQALKPEFVRDGLMLGEFHAHNHQSGLHNVNFRPLRSPVPMLVIRQMVPSDIAFLSRADDSSAARVDFLTSFLACQSELTATERAYAEDLLQAAARECALNHGRD